MIDIEEQLRVRVVVKGEEPDVVVSIAWLFDACLAEAVAFEVWIRVHVCYWSEIRYVVGDKRLNLRVEIHIQLVHLRPLILYHKQNAITCTAKLEADVVTVRSFRVPESRVTSDEEMCCWCIVEDGLD